MNNRHAHGPDGKAKQYLPATGSEVGTAAMRVGVLSAVVKAVGAIKVVYLANLFGTHDELDAYLIAFLLPSFAADIAGGALTSALIPCFVAAREREGMEAVHRLFSNLMVATLVCLGLLSVLLAAGADWIMGWMGAGFDPAKISLTRSLFYLMLPILAMSGLGAMWRAVLNSQGQFSLAAVVQVLTPLHTMLVAAMAAREWGAYSLAVGSLGGALLEIVVLASALRGNQMPFRLRWFPNDAATRSALKQFLPLVSASLVLGVGTLVTQILAARLPSGSVSALNYANKVVNVILIVGPTALGTVVLPHFSQLWARGERSVAWKNFRTYGWLVLAVTIPATAVFIVFSEPLIRLLYERGAFTAADTKMVAVAQNYFVLQLPAVIISVLAVRLLTSMQLNWQLLRAAVVNLLVLGTSSFLLMSRMGIAGLAMASSIAASFYTIYLLAVLWTEKKKESEGAADA